MIKVTGYVNDKGWINHWGGAPPLSCALHCFTQAGAQQMEPVQHSLPPQPSKAHIWQHSGSIALSPSGLQSQQEQRHMASWSPPQKTPKQLIHQQSQQIHWHIKLLLITSSRRAIKDWTVSTYLKDSKKSSVNLHSKDQPLNHFYLS